MPNRMNDYNKVLRLALGESCTVNWSEESGGVVYNCNSVYVLFEVAAYGGVEYYHGTYLDKKGVSELLNEAYDWT